MAQPQNKKESLGTRARNLQERLKKVPLSVFMASDLPILLKVVMYGWGQGCPTEDNVAFVERKINDWDSGR